MAVDARTLQFKHPFTSLIAGPTGAGKTFLLRRILGNHGKLISTNVPRLKVLWAYGIWQKAYVNPITNVDIRYVEGLPNEEEIMSDKPHVIVIDDLMTELSSDKKLTNLFTRGSHHLEISIFFLCQNFFYQGSQMKTITGNCQYIILLKNPRDKKQVSYLANQAFLGQAPYFMASYHDATRESFGYLLVDLTQDTPEDCRLRTRIIPDEQNRFSPIIYKPK